jgi:hypothetical protein
MNYCKAIISIVVISTLFVPIHAVFAEAAPYAQVLAPTFVTEQSVRLNGRVSGNEMLDTRTWFEWGASRDQAHYAETLRRTTGAFVGDLNADITGLAPDTEYFARFVAENSRGKSVGGTIYFRTQSLPMTNGVSLVVKTFDPTFVDSTSAILRGYAAPSGSTDGKMWFAWGKTTTIPNETPRNFVGFTSREYSYALSNLEPGTIYYYRAAGLGALGRVQGEIKWFLTPGEVPKVNSSNEGNTTSGSGSTANSNGNSTVLGVATANAGTISDVRAEPFYSSVNVYFDYSGVSAPGRALIEWGTAPELGRLADIIMVNGSGQVFGIVAPLASCTKYYYRPVITVGSQRSVAVTRSFVTTGLAGAPCGETSSSGTINPSTPIAGASNPGVFGGAQQASTTAPAPGFQMPGWKPGPIFGIPFPGTQAANTASSSGAGQVYGSERNGNATPVGVPGFFSRLFGGGTATVAANKPLVVTVTSKGDGGSNTPVEYRVAYIYKGATPLEKAVLKVILPKDVVYIGDDTTNEFFLEDNAGDPERTYILPLGTLHSGDTRTITMLGMTTSDAKNVPEARARVEYLDPLGSGVSVVSSGGTEAAAQTAAVANAGGGVGVIPHTLLGWLFFVFIVALIVVGIRFGRAYYTERKAELDAIRSNEESDEGRSSLFSPPPPLEYAQVSTREEPDPKTGLTSSLFASLPR